MYILNLMRRMLISTFFVVSCSIAQLSTSLSAISHLSVRYFLWKLMTVLLMEDAWYNEYTWPLLVFLFSCCVYPLASSCAHTFSTMSTRSRHICYFFDYGALSLYSLGKRNIAIKTKFKLQGCALHIFKRHNGFLTQLMQIQFTLHNHIQSTSILYIISRNDLIIKIHPTQIN